MPPRSKTNRTKRDRTTLVPFHERFDIPLDTSQLKQRFVNRANNLVFDRFIESKLVSNTYDEIRLAVAMDLGDVYIPYFAIKQYVGGDFYKCLQVIETTHRILSARHPQQARELNQLVQTVLENSEKELGISWQNRAFARAGARLLDDELINTSLQWLSNPKFRNVYDPFAKGLRHFLDAEKRPEMLYDVITDMYESIEALSKIVTGRSGKDLSANSEIFIKQVKASPAYKVLLKDYIAYANNFRHAVEEGKTRPIIEDHEAESFIYLTGLFIRLAMKHTD